jgi:hypothetical protein
MVSSVAMAYSMTMAYSIDREDQVAEVPDLLAGGTEVSSATYFCWPARSDLPPKFVPLLIDMPPFKDEYIAGYCQVRHRHGNADFTPGQ